MHARKKTLLQDIGFLLVLLTFIAKEGLREYWKNDSEALEKAQAKLALADFRDFTDHGFRTLPKEIADEFQWRCRENTTSDPAGKGRRLCLEGNPDAVQIFLSLKDLRNAGSSDSIREKDKDLPILEGLTTLVDDVDALKPYKRRLDSLRSQIVDSKNVFSSQLDQLESKTYFDVADQAMDVYSAYTDKLTGLTKSTVTLRAEILGEAQRRADHDRYWNKVADWGVIVLTVLGTALNFWGLAIGEDEAVKVDV